MIEKNLFPGILLKKYFGKLLLSLGLVAVLIPAQTGRAFASKPLPDGPALAQQRVVTGMVTENDGSPLPSVSIMEKGTTNGVMSDASGQFRISTTTAEPVLVFSFVGYETQEVSVGTRSVVNVVMTASTIGLEEIVVVGYGTVRKSDITGSITSVDVDKIRDVPAATVVKALQGKTAGVEIQNIGRQPGAGSQIRIRGSRSLSGSNDPLIIVDGIPYGGNLSDIASDDIAGLEVLKDASATAIYGSRGSNGVIIITTRKGESGAIRVNYNGYYGLNTVAREYDLFNAEEFIKLRTVANYTNYMPDETESMLLGRETDWQGLMYQTGQTHSHELGFSGGSDNFQYSLSGGYYNETGIIPVIEYSRYNLRLAIDQQIGKRFRLGVTSMNSMSVTTGNDATRMMWGIYSLSPLMVPYETDGTVNKQPAFDTDYTYNPLTFLDQTLWGDENRRHSSFNTMYLEVDLFEGLKYRANLGYDLGAKKYGSYHGKDTEMRQGSDGTGQLDNAEDYSYTIENLLLYDKTFGNHRLGLTAMQSIQESTSTESSFTGTTLATDYIQWNNFRLFEVVDATADNTTRSIFHNYYNNWTLASFMGRINYSLLDRYLITVTARSDGSSRLAPGKKWHHYPAVALAWKVKEESFLRNSEAISTLKLRAGYGQTANTSISPYRTLGGMSGTVYSFGDRGVNGYYVSTLPNIDLTWEYTKQTNLGLDFGFLSDRINGSVDFYFQQTEGVLLGVALPPSQGVPGSFLKNIGSTENKGLEVVLNGIILSPSSEKGLSWEVNTNVFLNREKITALQDTSVTQDIGNGWFVGYPASAIYDYVKLGIWQLGEEVQAATYGAKPGDIKFEDLDPDGDGPLEPDGKIDDKDRKVLGSSQPKLMGGFTSTWGWQGFDLSVVGYFRVGGLIASTLHMPNNYWNRLDGRRGQLKVDYWSPDNPTNDMPKPDMSINAARSNVLGYFDGSFLKIRSINLGYNIDKKYTQWLGANSGIRLYASVTDPFIFFSPYIRAGGLDPEPTNNASADNSALSMPNRTLVVGTGIPPVRKYVFGLNVKF
jgi:TonB-linked SusC/RagA family outer membrane protein